jgi:hypothetical protein
MLRKCVLLSRSGRCGWEVENYCTSKMSLICKGCQHFGHTQCNSCYAPWCMACGDVHPLAKCVTPKLQLQYCSCRGNNTAKVRGCIKWQEANTAAAKTSTSVTQSKGWCFLSPACTEFALSRSSPEQELHGPIWNHIIREGVIYEAHTNALQNIT